MKQPKIRPGAGTPKRTEATGKQNGASSLTLPHAHCTNADGQMQAVFKLSDLLPHGAENAVTTAALMDFTGLTRQQLQQLIKQERTSGKLILSKASGDGGYFLPDPDPDKGRAEIRRFRSTVLNRGVNTIRLVTMCDQALATLPGQERIEDDDSNGG